MWGAECLFSLRTTFFFSYNVVAEHRHHVLPSPLQRCRWANTPSSKSRHTRQNKNPCHPYTEKGKDLPTATHRTNSPTQKSLIFPQLQLQGQPLLLFALQTPLQICPPPSSTTHGIQTQHVPRLTSANRPHTPPTPMTKPIMP